MGVPMINPAISYSMLSIHHKRYASLINQRLEKTNAVSVSKCWTNIYRPDEQESFELYGNFICLQVFYSKHNYIYGVLTHSVRPYLVNCVGLVGIVNTGVLKIRTIFHWSQVWKFVQILNTAIYIRNKIDINVYHHDTVRRPVIINLIFFHKT